MFLHPSNWGPRAWIGIASVLVVVQLTLICGLQHLAGTYPREWDRLALGLTREEASERVQLSSGRPSVEEASAPAPIGRWFLEVRYSSGRIAEITGYIRYSGDKRGPGFTALHRKTIEPPGERLRD